MAESPDQYRRRLLSYSKGRDPLRVQAATPSRIELKLRGVRAAKLRKRPAPDKWSVAEIVAHLADSELVRGFRIRMILSAPGTAIQAFNQDEWVRTLHYDRRDVHESLQQFRALREANLGLLKSLSPRQLECYGLHSDRGRESVKTMVQMSAGHDLNHLRQIQRILASENRPRRLRKVTHGRRGRQQSQPCKAASHSPGESRNLPGCANDDR